MSHVCNLLNKYHPKVCYSYMFLFSIGVQNSQWWTPQFLHVVTRLMECTSGISHVSSSRKWQKGSEFAHTSTSEHSTHNFREVLLQWYTEAKLLGTTPGLIGGWARHFQQSDKLLRTVLRNTGHLWSSTLLAIWHTERRCALVGACTEPQFIFHWV